MKLSRKVSLFITLYLHLCAVVKTERNHKRALPDKYPAPEQIEEIKQELNNHAAAHPDGIFNGPAANDFGYEVSAEKYWTKAFDDDDDGNSHDRERAQKKYEMLLRNSALELGIHAWRHKMRARDFTRQMTKAGLRSRICEHEGEAYRALAEGIAQGRRNSDAEAADRYLSVVGLTPEEHFEMNQRSLLKKLKQFKKVPTARLLQARAAFIANQAHSYFDLVKSRNKLASTIEKHQRGEIDPEKMKRTERKALLKENAIAQEDVLAAAELYQYFLGASFRHRAKADAIQPRLPLMRTKTAIWTDKARRGFPNVAPEPILSPSSSRHFSDEEGNIR